jgi:hypothetical protein
MVFLQISIVDFSPVHIKVGILTYNVDISKLLTLIYSLQESLTKSNLGLKITLRGRPCYRCG